MKKTIKDVYPIGTKLFFGSGNYVGHEGKVIDVQENCKDKRAIYGFLITVQLQDCRIVYVEKSEHIQKIK